MNAEMLASWQQWHSDVSLEVMPMPNLSFEQAWNIQQAEIDRLSNELTRKDELINSCISTISKYNGIKK